MVLSILMDTERNDTTSHHEPSESAPCEPEGEAPSQPAPNGKINLFRQLGRNLKDGARMALSLRVEPEQVCGTPGVLALLVVLDFVLNLAVSFLLVGRGGYFAYSSVPSFFFHLPLFLFFGYLAARLLTRSQLAMALPAALIALSIPIELVHSAMERIAQLRQFQWLGDYLEATHYYRFFWWWAATALLFLLRLKGPAIKRRLAVLPLFVVLVVAPLWYYSRPDLWVSASEEAEGGELHLTDQVLSAQEKLLKGQLAGLLPGRKGSSNLYFVGFAGDGGQDVFLKELTAAERLFSRRFGTYRRSVILANNPQTATTLPFATAENLQRALDGVGKAMNRDDDVLFLFLTSHGSREHELAVENRPLELSALTPEKVRKMLRESRIKWKVVVVSACFAGGFIEPLKDDGTLIITAADATHESFGCGYGDNFTWFGEAFIDDALRHTYSFTDAFQKARETIRQWEKEQGETPSNPQLWEGKAIKPKLVRLERELERSGRP